MNAAKGRAPGYPLTPADLPFTVPETGRYWITYSGRTIQLPEAPKGSVLKLNLGTGRDPNGGEEA